MALAKKLFAPFILSLSLAGCCFKGVCVTPPAVPTPTPTATPTEAPVVTPTPTPFGPPATPSSQPTAVTSPSPTPVSCTSSEGTCTHTNPGQSGKFRKVFYQAMQNTFTNHPDYFYPKGTAACQYEVLPSHLNDYYASVQEELHKIYGAFCTSFDGENVNVKLDNSYSESFHPLRTDGDIPPSQCLSDINGIFTFTCTPAGF